MEAQGAGSPLALELCGVTKRFGDVTANDHVDLGVQRGSIHALVGENGAGKSTLMKIVAGLHQPSSGEIRVNGRVVSIANPHDAFKLGIGMVHQHFMLFPHLSVAENVVMGAEPKAGLRFNKAAAVEATRSLAARYGFNVDPLATVGALSVGIQQRVEILKTLYREADMIILDEPTAVLTPQETDDLLLMLRELARSGKTIIIITHKLREVMAVSDDVTVLRDGRVTGTLVTSQTNPHDIAQLMVGRELQEAPPKLGIETGNEILKVDELSVFGTGGLPLVDHVSFAIRRGEIVGIAGVAGNGQSELIEAITGLRAIARGRMALCGKDITGLSVRQIREAGVAHVPEDRFAYGLAAEATIKENVTLGPHYRSPLSNGFLLRLGKIRERARQLVQTYKVRTPDVDVKAEALSGGNLQKVVIAREMDWDAPLLIAAQPTRGVDIGAMEFIHAKLLEKRNRGEAVLLVSAELSEILGLSDRVLVMYKGAIVGEGRPDQWTQQELGLLMAGVKESHVEESTVGKEA
jgi:simple sugar transport system ATP-binding protein